MRIPRFNLDNVLTQAHDAYIRGEPIEFVLPFKSGSRRMAVGQAVEAKGIPRSHFRLRLHGDVTILTVHTSVKSGPSVTALKPLVPTEINLAVEAAPPTPRLTFEGPYLSAGVVRTQGELEEWLRHPEAKQGIIAHIVFENHTTPPGFESFQDQRKRWCFTPTE